MLPDYYAQTLKNIYHENQIYTIGYWQDVDDSHVEYVLNVLPGVIKKIRDMSAAESVQEKS